MPTYRDEAIVLRTQKLGESDRIITLLTRRLGKVRAVGRGVRKTKSKFGARLEPAMVIDVQCYEGRSLDTVTQTESIDPLGDRLARGIETTAASVMLETLRPTDRGTRAGSAAVPPCCVAPPPPGRGPRPQPRPRRLPATGDGDRRLCPEFPRLREMRCAGPTSGLQRRGRGSVCPLCRPPGSAAPARETLGLLSALLTGDWVIADASDPRHRREGAGLVAAFLQWHLERGLRSLRMVER